MIRWVYRQARHSGTMPIRFHEAQVNAGYPSRQRRMPSPPSAIPPLLPSEGMPPHDDRTNADLLGKCANNLVAIESRTHEESREDDGEQHNPENEEPIEAAAAFKNAAAADRDPRRDKGGLQGEKGPELSATLPA
jgi:hypothetical protein